MAERGLRVLAHVRARLHEFVPAGHWRRMEKFWINPVVAGAIGLLGMATAPVRSLATGMASDRDRRSARTARLAQERAYAVWAFDQDHQVWMPGVLRR